jgi:hypothetical protein
MRGVPYAKKKPRKRNKDGTRRKKRSDAGKKREKTMSNNARDEQFQGFAKALWQDIAFTHGDNVQRDVAYNIKVIEELIARRAYDFACHIMGNPQAAASIEEMVSIVPDMAELPKEQGSAMYSVGPDGYRGAEALEVLRYPEQGKDEVKEVLDTLLKQYQEMMDRSLSVHRITCDGALQAIRYEATITIIVEIAEKLGIKLSVEEQE